MLWLVRHGESEANAGGVTSDDEGIGLTSRGRVQAEAIAAACSERPAWVGLSPYLRARQTAEPLLAKHAGVPIDELPVQEFSYLSAARCVGLSVVTRRPLRVEYWSRMDPEYVDGDGAESFAMMWKRASTFLRWVEGRKGLGIVFSHAQFITAVIIEALYGAGEPTEGEMRRFFAAQAGLPVPNGAIVRLRREENRWWVGGVDCAHWPSA